MTSQPIDDLLAGLRRGDEDAAKQLFPLVYAELRQLARHYMRSERSGHTLQATALVNEAFLKLVGGAACDVRDRAHFIALAATAMRRILVDHARARNTGKRKHASVPLDDAMQLAQQDGGSFLAVHEALRAFEKLDPLRARMFELQFVVGMKTSEVAEALGVSPQKVRYGVDLARAWMRRALEPGTPPPSTRRSSS